MQESWQVPDEKLQSKLSASSPFRCLHV